MFEMLENQPHSSLNSTALILDIVLLPTIVDMIFCGGALIAPDTVLTAAHCGDFTNKQIIVGGYELRKINNEFNAVSSQQRFCDHWISHPQFDTLHYRYADIALCKLNEPVLDIDPLALNQDSTAVTTDGEPLVAMGLGDLLANGSRPSLLQTVNVSSVSNEGCQSYYEGLNGDYIIDDNKVCAGNINPSELGQDVCKGDSGGPLVQRRQVLADDSSSAIVDTHIGLVSYGVPCAIEGAPSVYTRTSSYTDWITETICSDDFGSMAPFCNNENNPPSPIDHRCDGNTVELVIEITTDQTPYETSWELYNSDLTIVQQRVYGVANFTNTHSLCLDENSTYTFVLRDDNGFCDIRNRGDLCGTYSLSLVSDYSDDIAASTILAEGTGDFTLRRTVSFFVPPSVSSPSSAPSRPSQSVSLKSNKLSKKKKKKNKEEKSDKESKHDKEEKYYRN